MLNLNDDQWNALFDEVDKTIIKAQEDLPSPVREKAEQIQVIVNKYQFPLDR
mgnify:CR=1 FL=1